MRRFTTYAIAVLIAGSAAIAVQAQTPETLDKAMKTVGPSWQATNKAIKTMAWDDAKKSVAALEGAFADAHKFWVSHGNAEALKMSTDAVAKLGALKTALDAPTPDSAAVAAAQKEFGSTCGACHKQFREQDANGQYNLKAGA